MPFCWFCRVAAHLMKLPWKFHSCNISNHKWVATWQNQQNDVRPVKTQISLGIRPVWSGSSLSAWRNVGSLATYWAHSEDSDQTGRMPRLIWVFAGRTLILLVLSRCGSNIDNKGVCRATRTLNLLWNAIFSWECARKAGRTLILLVLSCRGSNFDGY